MHYMSVYQENALQASIMEIQQDLTLLKYMKSKENSPYQQPVLSRGKEN